MLPLMLHLDTVIALVQHGIAAGKAIVQAVRDGRASVQDAAGRILTADDVEGHCDRATAAAKAAGLHAEQRIEDRHPEAQG